MKLIWFDLKILCNSASRGRFYHKITQKTPHWCSLNTAYFVIWAALERRPLFIWSSLCSPIQVIKRLVSCNRVGKFTYRQLTADIQGLNLNVDAVHSVFDFSLSICLKMVLQLKAGLQCCSRGYDCSGALQNNKKSSLLHAALQNLNCQNLIRVAQ